MNFKKILKRGLIIGIIISLIGLIGGAPELVLSFFVPPRLYVLLALIVILILLKSYVEIKNQRND